jgi:hypothetical protein
MDLVVGERNEPGAGIPSKRIRLSGPIQIAKRPRKATEVVLGSLVVFQGEQNVLSLFQQRSQPLVDFSNGLRQLLLPRGVRRGVHLALHLGARQTKRFDLSYTFGVNAFRALPRVASLLFAFFHSLGEAGLRVDEAFSCVTHTLRLSTHIRPNHNG